MYVLQIIMRVVVQTHVADLKVQVGAGGIAGRADHTDLRSLVYRGSTRDRRIRHVGVKGLEAIAMVDHDRVAIAPVCPTGVDHHTIIRGYNGCAGSGSVVHALVDAAYVVVSDDQATR